MLFITCSVEVSKKAKEMVRQELKERTGEDCVFIPVEFTSVQNIPVKKDFEGQVMDQLSQAIKAALNPPDGSSPDT